MLFVAKLYSKIMNIDYFYKISVGVEIISLTLVLYFLIFSYSYTTALFVYIGYQLTFTFGSYLVRAETIVLKRSQILTFLDVAKQKGYLIGMTISYIFYQIIEKLFYITNHQLQVYNIHYLLIVIELITIMYLLKSFQLKTKGLLEKAEY